MASGKGRRAAWYRGPFRPIGGNPELPARVRSAAGQILAHLRRLGLVSEFGEDHYRLGPGMARLGDLAVFRLYRAERAQRRAQVGQVHAFAVAVAYVPA